MANNSNNQGNEPTKPKSTAKRGFAAMDEATQRFIQRLPSCPAHHARGFSP